MKVISGLARGTAKAVVGLAWLALASVIWPCAGVEPALRERVEADWSAQEHRLGRQPDQAEAIRAALQRAEKLLAHLRAQSPAREWQQEADAFEGLRREAAGVEASPASARLALYRKVRRTAREWALANPLFAGRPLLFMKRNRYICQMLHEYMGYFYDYGNVAGGGGVYVLEQPGHSLKTRELLQGRLTNGNFTTLALAADAGTVWFAFAERSKKKPGFYTPERLSFHLFALNADGSNLRQLTHGVEDDFDPCPLPDGASPSCPRGAAGSRAATTRGNRAPATPCTAWMPTDATCASCRSTKPASGTRPS